MGIKTDIAWTNSTFNPWWICTEVSPGCDNCYARVLAKRWGYGWGKGVSRREFGDKHWNEPLKWEKAAAASGDSWRVFCGSMCDVMDDEAPTGARNHLWELIDATPHLTWQLLTKRPHRYKRFLPPSFVNDNVWLGCTTEDQHFYDVRWPILREAADMLGLTTFISYEPALGPLSLKVSKAGNVFKVPDWVICGGESGTGRRAMETVWAEDVKIECKRYGVKFYMKQMSAATPEKGQALIPAHLLVREFPE